MHTLPTQEALELLARTVTAMKTGAELIANLLPPDGDWQPHLVIARAGGGPPELAHIDPHFMDASKVEAAALMARLVGKKKAAAVVLVISAWYKEVSDADLPATLANYRGLKDDPDKKEMLIMGGFIPGQEAVWVSEITRQPGKRPRLGPWLLRPGATMGRWSPGIVEALQAWLN